MCPFIEEDQPDWKTDPKIGKDLPRYIEIHDEFENTWKVITSGPYDEITCTENALLISFVCMGNKMWRQH